MSPHYKTAKLASYNLGFISMKMRRVYCFYRKAPVEIQTKCFQVILFSENHFVLLSLPSALAESCGRLQDEISDHSRSDPRLNRHLFGQGQIQLILQFLKSEHLLIKKNWAFSISRWLLRFLSAKTFQNFTITTQLSFVISATI